MRRLVVVVLISVCIADTDIWAEEKEVHPLLRFWVAKDDTVAAEYVGDLHSEFARTLKDINRPSGTMQIECADVAQLGVALEPIGIGKWIYGANTKYRFAWRHLGFANDVVRRMRYHRSYRSGLVEDRIHLAGRQSRWLVDGIIRMELTVLKEVRYTTDFELINCGVTIEMPPEREPTQDILDRIERESQRL